MVVKLMLLNGLNYFKLVRHALSLILLFFLIITIIFYFFQKANVNIF